MSSLSLKLDTTPGRVLVLLARFVVGGVFLYAAWGKIQDPTAFALSIANYHMVSDGVAGAMAGALPLLEVVVGLALISGVHARGASVIAGGMLVVFSIAIAQAILRDIDVDCGCFGKAAQARVGWTDVLRDVGLTLLCALVVLAKDVPWRLSRRDDAAARPG